GRGLSSWGIYLLKQLLLLRILSRSFAKAGATRRSCNTALNCSLCFFNSGQTATPIIGA
ncbi:hypothetical protein NDU88_012482, partial [Pleurodeles waltl]